MTTRNLIITQKKYRLGKHKHWNTPKKIIQEYVGRITLSPVIDLDKIINGETNEVFSVKTKDELEYIFRFAHNKERNPFLKEAWVLRRCNDRGVPVPKILLIDSFKDRGKTVYVCAESKIRGVGLGELADTISRKKVEDILKQAGKVFRKIHSIKTEGFGDLNEFGEGKCSSVVKLITDFGVSLEGKVLTELKKKHDDLVLVKKAYKILHDNQKDIYVSSPFVIHNDISPDHIIVYDNKVSGIIDFESAKGADPILEFTRWDFKFSKRYPITCFLEGYGYKKIKDFKKRFNYWMLFRLLLSLRYCIDEKKKDGISYALREIEKTLNLFA